MVTLTPSSSSTPKTSFDFTKSNNSHSLHVPFPSSSSYSSSYLSNKEAALVKTKKLMEEPSKTLTISINETKMANKAPHDPEIGVFGAEKYFNGDMDSDQSSSVLSLTNLEVERFIVETKKSTGTPSVRSESSWNSQSVLLHKKIVSNSNSSLEDKKKNNNGQIQKVSSTNKKSLLATFGCKCACSDRDSVDVDENISALAVRKIENEMNLEKIKIQKQEELGQRKSVEVFGSPINIAKKRIETVEMKHSMNTWESRTEEEEEDTKSGGSDTSSDLFEIPSLTGKPKPILARQVSDPASPTCYAPSEVSVEWSIVTASAADFSVMSECATSPVRRINRSSQIPQLPSHTAKSSSQRRKASSSGSGGGFLSCKSHKSVRVSEDSERRISMSKTSPSYVPRFPMETSKHKSFETQRKIRNTSISHTQPYLMYK